MRKMRRERTLSLVTAPAKIMLLTRSGRCARSDFMTIEPRETPTK